MSSKRIGSVLPVDSIPWSMSQQGPVHQAAQQLLAHGTRFCMCAAWRQTMETGNARNRLEPRRATV
jgi:hypothetical protein